MKNLEIELSLSFINEQGRKVETKASIGGDWFQWGGTESELFETMDIVNKLNETLNENFFEELASEEEDKE